MSEAGYTDAFIPRSDVPEDVQEDLNPLTNYECLSCGFVQGFRPSDLIKQLKLRCGKCFSERGFTKLGPCVPPDVQSQPDVRHQAHYQGHGIEPIEIIKGMGDLIPSCRANIIKYVCRYQWKGSPIQDLEKARVYLEWLIEAEREAREE